VPESAGYSSRTLARLILENLEFEQNLRVFGYLLPYSSEFYEGFVALLNSIFSNHSPSTTKKEL
jgi:hypothetical protein